MGRRSCAKTLGALDENHGGMMAGAVVRNVFLDAEVFIDAGFNYQTQRLQSLRRLAQDGSVRIYLTAVTRREVEANIRESIDKAANQKPPAVLRNSVNPDILARLKPIDLDSLATELCQQLDDYLESAGAVVLPVSGDLLSPVLARYFELLPPFGTGKNKAEFPDALSAETLREWCSANKQNMAVITRDAGLAACCDGGGPLIAFEEVAKYLDAVASEDIELASRIRESVPLIEDQLFDLAAQRFSDLEFYLGDEEGDVDSVEYVQVDWAGDPEIAYLSPSEAIVELPVEFSAVACVSYYQQGNGIYDREDGALYFRDIVEHELPFAVERTLTVYLDLSDDVAGLTDVRIDYGRRVRVLVNEDDPFD